MIQRHNDCIIFVIIVTWNGMKWIDRCLSGLRASTVSVSTIVVDNGSSDGIVEHIQEAFPEVSVHQMDKNLGFGQANNFGIKKALEQGADFVYLLNQDAYVYPDMFDHLLDVYSSVKDSNIGIISPLHLYRDKVHLDSHFKSYLSTISAEMTEDLLLRTLKPYYTVDMVPAAGWLLPKKTLEVIGGFDPIFFHYGEDDQYAQRIKYHGLSIVVVPKAKMIHDRDGFGNDKMARRDEFFSGLKTYYFLNINYNKKILFKKLTKIALSYLFESTRCLLRGNFKNFWQYHFAIIWNIVNIPKYRKNRCINRQKGANWL